jgi:hypothetical protein
MPAAAAAGAATAVRSIAIAPRAENPRSIAGLKLKVCQQNYRLGKAGVQTQQQTAG